MSKHLAVTSFNAIIFLIAMSLVSEVKGKTNKELMEYLFNSTRYDKRILPSIGAFAPLNVSVDLSVLQIENLDEKQQFLLTHVIIIMEWRDPKLMWNPAEYNNIRSTTVGKKDIWIPDIVIYNSVASDNPKGMRRTDGLLHHNGLITLRVPKIMQSSCKTNVANYPFDWQKCEVMFGSWAYDGFDVAVDSKHHVDLSGYVKNGEWELIDFTVEQHRIVYGCCPEPYYDVTYYVKVRRQVLYYAIYYIIPCALIALLAATIFVLPEDCSERITVGMCTLVGLSFFFLLVSENMPASSTLPLIGGYYSVTMIQMGVSFYMNIIVLRFHHMTDEEVPDWVRKYILGYGALLLRTKFHGKQRQSQDITATKNNAESTNDYKKAPDAKVFIKKRHLKEIINSDEIIATAVEEDVEGMDRDNEWKKAAHVLNNLALILHLLVVLFTFAIMFFEVLFIAEES